jgi:hypothetical protein
MTVRSSAATWSLILNRFGCLAIISLHSIQKTLWSAPSVMVPCGSNEVAALQKILFLQDHPPGHDTGIGLEPADVDAA